MAERRAKSLKVVVGLIRDYRVNCPALPGQLRALPPKFVRDEAGKFGPMRTLAYRVNVGTVRTCLSLAQQKCRQIADIHLARYLPLHVLPSTLLLGGTSITWELQNIARSTPLNRSGPLWPVALRSLQQRTIQQQLSITIQRISLVLFNAKICFNYHV